MRKVRFRPMLMTHSCLFLVALTGSVAASAAGTKIYCWTDDKGARTCSDVMPPEEVNRQHKVVNDQGITIKSVDRAKTAEEIEQQREETEAQEHAEMLKTRQETEQRRRDQMLLQVYASEADLQRMRDDRMAALDTDIQMSQSTIKNQQASLDALLARAADEERSGEPADEQLQRDISDLRKQIEQQHTFIQRKQEGKEQVEEQYQADLQRFRELHETDPTAADAGTATAPTSKHAQN